MPSAQRCASSSLVGGCRIPNAMQLEDDQASVGWGFVHGRHAKLQQLAERLGATERRFRDAVEAVHTGRTMRNYRRWMAVGAEFQFYGEAAFMFADAALNCLADVVVETVKPGHDSPMAYAELAAKVLTDQMHDLPTLRDVLRPHSGLMQSGRVRVSVPRSVLAVHPPAGLSPGGYRLGPEEPVRLMASRWHPNEQRQHDDEVALERQLAKDAAVPADVSGVGDFLVMWAIEQVAEHLSMHSVAELRRYMRRHGGSAAPSLALAEAQAVIERLSEAMGRPITDPVAG
jgi:hypothetical protein